MADSDTNFGFWGAIFMPFNFLLFIRTGIDLFFQSKNYIFTKTSSSQSIPFQLIIFDILGFFIIYSFIEYGFSLDLRNIKSIFYFDIATMAISCSVAACIAFIPYCISEIIMLFKEFLNDKTKVLVYFIAVAKTFAFLYLMLASKVQKGILTLKIEDYFTGVLIIFIFGFGQIYYVKKIRKEL